MPNGGGMMAKKKREIQLTPINTAVDFHRSIFFSPDINTGFPRVIADTIVNRLQWKKDALIDDYIASDEVEKGRPFPFMINELMFRAGLHDPKQVLKAGDTEVDINEGRSAGCGLVIGVTTGAFTRQQLEPYRPDFILDNLLSLPEIILH